jgi:hypothetical protein
LEKISKSAQKDVTLIYACVLDAQETGNKGLAGQALQMVLERYNYQSPDGVHFPALLRCLLKLKQSELVKDEILEPELMETFSRIFERAATEAGRTSNAWVPEELEWFSRNCYNFAVERCAELHPSHLSRLSTAGLRFIELLTKSTPGDELLKARFILCHYLSLVSHVILARKASDNTESNSHYVLVQKHALVLLKKITLYQELHPGGSSPKRLRVDPRSKFTDAVKYNMEATLRLRKWEGLDQLLDMCFTSTDLMLEADWVTFADLGLLINQDIGQVNQSEHILTTNTKLLAFISETIQKASRAPDPKFSLIARYIRTLFTMTLPHHPQISEALITHVVNLCQASGAFPMSTVEYLSTTTFNHAVDCFSAGDDDACREWAARAMTLATALADGGSLRQLLSERTRLMIN